MITGANISAGGSGCLRSDQRGLTPNCKNGDLRKDLRDYDRGDFVGDNGLGLVVVDVDRLKGAHAKRLPAVGHSVDMDTLERWRYRNGLRCGAGSCTHAPQAAVNDMAVGSETGSKDPHTHTCRQGWLYLEATPLKSTCECLFSGGLTSSHSVENVSYLSKTSVEPQDLAIGRQVNLVYNQILSNVRVRTFL